MSIYQSLSGFFGLTSNYRSAIFTQIHEIVFHGKGGYTWDNVYNMPIWLRRFTFEKIQEYYEKRNTQSEDQNPKQKPIKGPDIQPSYNVKASK